MTQRVLMVSQPCEPSLHACLVGEWVGASVGAAVGESEGAAVGAAVGTAVGAAVGAEVGWRQVLSTSTWCVPSGHVDTQLER